MSSRRENHYVVDYDALSQKSCESNERRILQDKISNEMKNSTRIQDLRGQLVKVMKNSPVLRKDYTEKDRFLRLNWECYKSEEMKALKREIAIVLSQHRQEILDNVVKKIYLKELADLRKDEMEIPDVLVTSDFKPNDSIQMFEPFSCPIPNPVDEDGKSSLPPIPTHLSNIMPPPFIPNQETVKDPKRREIRVGDKRKRDPNDDLYM